MKDSRDAAPIPHPNIMERVRNIPLNLIQYKQESALKKLPTHKIVTEGNKQYLEFSFPNGLRITTEKTEESIRDPDDTVRFGLFIDPLKVMKMKHLYIDVLMPNGTKKPIDLLDTPFGKSVDHYITFRPNFYESYCGPDKYIELSNRQVLHESKAHTVVTIPTNQKETAYNEEKFLAIWLHEAGHGNDFKARGYRVHYIKDQNYRKITDADDLYDSEKERGATARGTNFLRWVERTYGKPINISIERYSIILEEALKKKEWKSTGFYSMYSKESRRKMRTDALNKKRR